MSETPLKVFVSYSHDNEEHKEWVYRLSCDLIGNGIEVILDQWDLSLGSNLPKFMEQGLTNSDRVLVVCTDNYIDKSNDGIGGVGYEKNILTAELLVEQDSKKFIPIVKSVDRKVKTPICIAGRLYTDFSNDENYQRSLKELVHELYGIPLKPKPELGKNPFAKEISKMPSLRDEDSTVFFSRRFSSAFPGIRDIKWFRDPVVAVQRLSILLKEPLNFQDGTPIWWWRSGDLHIDTFEQLTSTSVLMNYEELIIDEVAAVNAGSYYQCFVYVKTKPSEPTGLYDCSYISDSVMCRGYAREEFALFNDRLISRAEYDDSAAIIDGIPTDLDGSEKLRVRYLTPYNFIIAPHNSPINHGPFDQRRDELLTGILNSENTLEEFTEEFMRLPKRGA